MIALLVVAVAAVSGCGREIRPVPPQPGTDQGSAAEFADVLRKKVTVEATMAHLGRLQEIADAHGGNRALGRPGYDASVDYVVNALRDKGFDVQVPEFEVRLPWADEPSLTVAGTAVTARAMEYTIGTESGGVAGSLVPARVDDTPGCTADDYDGLAVEGAVVLVDRGSCPFGAKQAIAAQRGAAALIVANNEDGDEMGGTLGEETDVKIPVISTTKASGERLRANPANTTIKLNAGVRTERTRNVVAQTKTGSTSNVVMAGAHLDSVPEGPGINDNGSGSSALLEVAEQLAKPANKGQFTNKLRFAWWGAEEFGLLGSRHYVADLKTNDPATLGNVALYLNFDMIGSPNHGRFVYDGDASAFGPADGSVPAPAGSAVIEAAFHEHFGSLGLASGETEFSGRSDYGPFIAEGIASGGLFTGAEGIKTVEQAALFGGRAGIGYDFCYHASCDDLSNIDHRTLDEMTGAASAVVLRFANSPLDLEEEGRRLLAAVAPVPAATVDRGHGPSNAAEAKQLH